MGEFDDLIKVPEKFDITKVRNVGKLPKEAIEKLSKLNKDISTDTLEDINKIFPNTIDDPRKVYKTGKSGYRVTKKSSKSTAKSIVANIKKSTKESQKLVKTLNKL